MSNTQSCWTEGLTDPKDRRNARVIIWEQMTDEAKDEAILDWAKKTHDRASKPLG